MQKEERQKIVFELIDRGLTLEHNEAQFEDLLDEYDPDLEYYDEDLGYMFGFSRGVLERQQNA